MAASSTTQVCVGGRLIANPSNFASPATDCGGTVLGNVQNAFIRITRKIDPITAAEWGSAMTDGILLDEEVEFSAVFSSWDEDAAAVWAYGGAVGAGAVPTVVVPGAYGSLVNTLRSPSLLWLPDDDTAHPAFYLYNAIPWSLPKRLRFSARHALTVEAHFLGLRDSNNAVFKSALLADL
jgi:hypothetical protein